MVKVAFWYNSLIIVVYNCCCGDPRFRNFFYYCYLLEVWVFLPYYCLTLYSTSSTPIFSVIDTCEANQPPWERTWLHYTIAGSRSYKFIWPFSPLKKDGHQRYTNRRWERPSHTRGELRWEWLQKGRKISSRKQANFRFLDYQ